MRNAFTSDLILFILTLSFSPRPHVEASLLTRQLHIRYNGGVHWTWEEARQMCRSYDATHHSDLAIMRNETEIQPVRDSCNDCTFADRCWIGLHRDDNDLNLWKWVNNETYNTGVWRAGHPATKDMCAHIRCTKVKLRGDDCSLKHFKSLCQVDNLILVKENKTWEEAIDHCRTLQVNWGDSAVGTDLLILHTEEELAYAQSMVREAQTGEVWIGLRWLAYRWLWLDGQTEAGVSMPACPANGMNCGTLSEEGKQATNCAERRNFFCFHRL